MRVLVTGSRDWKDYAAIEKAVEGTVKDTPFDTAVIVHGGASGADAMAGKCARRMGLREEVHAADWDHCAADCHRGHRRTNKSGRTFCPTAGHRRNQEMVDAGADVCLAFPMPGSRGTYDCTRRAKAAGIEIRFFDLRKEGS